MLKIPFLRNILLGAVLFAVIFPLFEMVFTIPSYRGLLIHEAEQEAARFVRFLVSSNSLNKVELHAGHIPSRLIPEMNHLKEEGRMVKLRIFSAQGEIIFSSDSEEIGTINKKGYFREIVAKGKLYSKMVKESAVTAEGVKTDHDLIETYVPIMAKDHFLGAMEVYSDVTLSQQKLSGLSQRSFLSLVIASTGFLALTLILLLRAKQDVLKRQHAEMAVQRANESLEERVRQRTIELSSANQQLAAEISEREKAQKAQKMALATISEARDRIDAIIRSVGDALLVTDHLDTVVLFNPAAEILFQMTADHVIGRSLPEVIGFDALLFEIAKARNELNEVETVEFDFELETSDSKRIYQGRASRLKDTHASTRGLVLLIHDVTRERQIDRMKSEFVSMAAHELQTPLTMILGYSELLLDPEKSFSAQELKDFLNIINDKSVELSRLIDDILDLSRIEEGRDIQIAPCPLDMGRLCEQILFPFEKANPQHRFVLERPQEALMVSADEVRMRQVMENLLGNAVKYSPEGGLVRVRLVGEKDCLNVDIIDQGIGMSEEQIKNAFERFYRGDASNTAVRGAGLGLSIARYIVTAHGGSIELHSTRGKGVKVQIRLPRVP